jgi:hypothetical protein
MRVTQDFEVSLAFCGYPRFARFHNLAIGSSTKLYQVTTKETDISNAL